MSNEVDQTPAPWPAPVDPGQPAQQAQPDYSWSQPGPGTVPPPAGWPSAPSVPPGGQTTNGLAIASLVLGLIGWLLFGVGGIIAIVLGLVARGQIKKSNGAQKGGGLAVAGITLGVLSLAVSAVLVAAVMTLGTTVDIPRDQFVTKVVAANETDPNFAPTLAAHPEELRATLLSFAGCMYDVISVEPLYMKAVYDEPLSQTRVLGVSQARIDELDAQIEQRCVPALEAGLTPLMGS